MDRSITKQTLLCAFAATWLGLLLVAAPVTAAPGGETPPSALDEAVKALPDSASSPTEHEAAGAPKPTADAPVPQSPGPIRAFFESWPLFHNVYLAGWLIAATLAMVGVPVLIRDQVFIGAAVSQALLLGIAIGLWLGESSMAQTWPVLTSGDFLSALAVAFSIAAALVTALGDHGQGRNSQVLAGWVFVLAASLSVLIVAHSAHGLEEVHRSAYSTLIGATRGDVLVFALLTVVTATCCIFFGRRLLLFALDPDMAAAVGMRTNRWAMAFYIWVGVCMGLSIRASGMLYAFGCLVLPAMIAKSVCREIRPMFIVAPIIGVATAAVGFVAAHAYDFPPAQMTVAIGCVVAVIASAASNGRKWMRRTR